MREFVNVIDDLTKSRRTELLKDKMLGEERYLSIEQAKIITRTYKEHAKETATIKRALCLYAALSEIDIRIDESELVVGNRTSGVRAGVVFPETGISWLETEIYDLPTRAQDKFSVHEEDVRCFMDEILPFWQGKTLEDCISSTIGEQKSLISDVVTVNQTDRAQGHICPNTEKWLKFGINGLLEEINMYKNNCTQEQSEFYRAAEIVLKGASVFIGRYEHLALTLANTACEDTQKLEYLRIADTCRELKTKPPQSFEQAIQSMWFLYVILQMESNASSFSPGRADQYLYPYFKKDIESNAIDYRRALDLVECLFIKFNQIVLLGNEKSVRFFAGFPIGFNVAIGGVDENGIDASNELSFLFLKAQEHLCLPQPNLSARVNKNSPQDLLKNITKVISTGSGMPQLFNDDAIIPALVNLGVADSDAKNYAIVGCVELTSQGNSLGWCNAAMFNLVKALELALNGGVCLKTGRQTGALTKKLVDCESYEEVEAAFKTQIDFFFEEMLKCCEVVEHFHAKLIPSPFLSTVVDDCIASGVDVTNGGATYNFSGIQAIQPANIADSLAALKFMVFDSKNISKQAMLDAMLCDFEGLEPLRLTLLNHIPKYGNDVEWVDKIAAKWIEYFAGKLAEKRNYRGGRYHCGLYTVSAHVPMGQCVGATCDGRKSGQPLADGGLSAVCGRDISGPTALLKSVSRISPIWGSNGTLLNMKFQPSMFSDTEGVEKFTSLIRCFTNLNIAHVQFNVVNLEDLKAAQKKPELYRSLTIRVAGYTAYFTELAHELQDEIIERTWYQDA